MKKKLFLVLCIVLSLLMLTACGRKQKTPERIRKTDVPHGTDAGNPTMTAEQKREGALRKLEGSRTRESEAAAVLEQATHCCLNMITE